MLQAILLRSSKPPKRIAASEQGAQVRGPRRVFLRTAQKGNHWGISWGSAILHYHIRFMVCLQFGGNCAWMLISSFQLFLQQEGQEGPQQGKICKSRE